jgi:hypothetical protein
MSSTLDSKKKLLKQGARPYLLASALVFSACLLLWQLGSWQSGKNATHRGETISKVSESADMDTSSAFSDETDKSEGQDPQQEKRNQQAALQTSNIITDGQPAGRSPGTSENAGSVKGGRSAALKTSSDPHPSLSSSENSVGMPVRSGRMHPASRRGGVADMVGRLPPQYFQRGSAQGATPGAGRFDVPKWPEATKAGKSADLIAARPVSGENGAGNPESSTAGQVIKFQEVPSKIRDSIPISISMLSYSKRAGDSWVNLNGLKMREGEQMPSGPKVETITPDGVILSYQGHNFFKGVKED